jgi:hypothetical protein
MHDVYKRTITLIIFSLFFVLSLYGQYVPSDERGDPLFRRQSDMEANNVKASVFNFGFSGRTQAVATEFPYEWPKNTDREYIALIAIWMAGEVTDENGQTIQIVDFPTYRENSAGESWNLEPVPGYINPDQDEIARSDIPESWPIAPEGWRDKQDDLDDPGWVGSWNGFFGKNIFNADVEMFYKSADNLYDRFNYIPDETDPSRGGLGLVLDVRALAWTQILVSDVIFYIHDILNDGTKRISKTSFLIWIADIVGGDANDDEPFVDLQSNIAFLTDADRIGTEPFGTDPVGLGSIKFLETPGNQSDGIDNDGDADFYPDLLNGIDGDPSIRVPLFTENDFLPSGENRPRTILPGEKLVLIDSLTFERRVIEYPAGGGVVISLGQEFNLPPGGATLVEDTLANQLDGDLDGLIDERLTLHLEKFDETTGSVRPVRYINYLSFEIGDTIKRGYVVPGKSQGASYENIAPMIDESRDDFFDNDRDWNSLQDDVGLNGVEGDGDFGEGDGLPTSGSGTAFPGEPNIDKTDVTETDVIGITSAIQDPAFNINFNDVSDAFIWRTFMTPGKFFLPRPTGEYDMYISSGYFPIDPGERQRMAISVAMAGGGLTKADDIASAKQKQKQAQTAYETDYRFAKAPIPPNVTAVPGDKRVTLYWDDVAEFSFDEFIDKLGGNAFDFEGYRIYRATDAAFLDAKIITDGQGVKTLLKPIKQFDLDDGIQGYHPVDINGVKFDLGTDSGLLHSFTDTSNVINGQRYFYAVTSYDFGFEFGGVAPSESFIKINVDPQGNITTGSNVVVVRPRTPIAGYLPTEIANFEHIRGSSTGDIEFDIVDPNAIKDGTTYEITFEDTIFQDAIGRQVLTTKNFTLTNVSDGIVEIDRDTTFHLDDEVPLVDGFRLKFFNEERVLLDQDLSSWSEPNIFAFQFEFVKFLLIQGQQRPNDYQIVFGDVGFGRSKDTTISFLPLPAKDVNFQVFNISDNIPVEFGFAEIDGTDGRFSIDTLNANFTDTIFLLEPDETGKLVYTWQVTLNLQPPHPIGRNPRAGDTLNVFLKKPFLSKDIYSFTMKSHSESKELAKDELENIRVVPNPYIAAERWEPRNTFSSGRGPREIHFINLPKQCTIRIFNVNGVLVDKIEHSSTFDNGTAIWDVLSRDNLEISYGIYVYHVDAPGIGEKKGTFAIIK